MRRMWKIGLVVLLIGIMSLGYGGLCKKDSDHDTTNGSSAPNTVTLKNMIWVSGATTPIDIYIDGILRDGNVKYGETSSMSVPAGHHTITAENTEGGGVAGYWWAEFDISGGATLNLYVDKDAIKQF